MNEGLRSRKRSSTLRMLLVSIFSAIALMGWFNSPAIAEVNSATATAMESSNIHLATKCLYDTPVPPGWTWVSNFYEPYACDNCWERGKEGYEGGAWSTFACLARGTSPPNFFVELWVRP